jgi:uncharacterized alpha-E superfamily protein
MLSRVAESVFWMSRYIERAENVARYVDVTQTITLGGIGRTEAQWAPLVYASGDEQRFQELYGEFSKANVLHFLTFDERNGNSILSCLIRARENARTIRDILSTALWEAINRFYLRVREAARDRPRVVENPHDFLERVKRSSHQVIGVTEATLSHGEAWNFATLGRLIERADKTSRILDVKYFILLPDASHVGSTLDIVQWSALLESTSALHMYRKRFGRIAPKNVADFLILDRQFPRSIRFCVAQAEECLHAITGSAPGLFANRAEQLLGQLNARLSYMRVDDIMAEGLHEFVDDFQGQLNEIGGAIHKTFFEVPAAPMQISSQSEPDARSVRVTAPAAQTQSQFQSSTR